MVIIGIPVGIGGVVVYNKSSSAAAGEQEAANDSLKELSVTPSPYFMPSARGVGVSIGSEEP